MKISVSSYSFHQYIEKGLMTQLDCVAKAKEMGFDAIEFIDIDGKGDLPLQKENARKIRAEADRLGIAINAYTIGACLYHDTQEAMDAEVERLLRLGATRKDWNYEPDADYVVLQDPDGNPFCVVQA